MQKIHKKFQIAFLLVVFLVGGVVSSFVVRAACDDDSVTCLEKENKEKADDLKDELESIDAKIKAYKQIVDLKQRQGATLAEQIEGLQAQADKLQ